MDCWNYTAVQFPSLPPPQSLSFPSSLFQQNEAIIPSFNSLLKSSKQALQQQTQTFKATKILQTCFYMKLNKHTQSIQLDFLIFCKAIFCSMLFSYIEFKLSLSYFSNPSISLTHSHSLSFSISLTPTHPPTHTHPHTQRAWHKREISRYYKGKQSICKFSQGSNNCPYINQINFESSQKLRGEFWFRFKWVIMLCLVCLSYILIIKILRKTGELFY